MAEKSDEIKVPRDIAMLLITATALSDREIFTGLDPVRYTTVDYYRMACHLIFRCARCGNCCRTGDPIRLRASDATAIARHLKIPMTRFMKKYAVSDPEKPKVLNFKHILPCKFYDKTAAGCKIYSVRPWSCRIFPFLGIYGSEDRVVVNESCPGSVEAMRALTEELEKLQQEKPGTEAFQPEEIKKAKMFLRHALDLV
jgi:Fe-S-cluster containining protein